MNTETKRKPGRPAMGFMRYSITLRPEDVQRAQELGEGNISLGVRKALKETLPNPRPPAAPVSQP